ncbi:hypothetical protein A2129_01115 [Candidatus Woesebacteria bacterium GWC1_42_13]|uniref:Uncharacterized protein n=2 Tax=Candidatus Woeseibacteriota TaxID=1752722 RepID=A0A1F7WXM0_9BACT|nr:MAG: hypothetical protein A2112_00835 [Candidatus Woesebacteria bacterium GWA1_42_12]OGM06835.1 MAG: hypothetical protein A2129_01115 [Candidatus Woesebacteria bacterium GWC1_42_13]
MTESGEVGRRTALKAGILGTLAAALAIKGVDLAADRQTDLKDPRNLEAFTGIKPLFPGIHLNTDLVVNEGAGIYKEPRKERSEIIAENSLRVGSQTLMGTLGRNEGLKVQGAYLALHEADDSIDKAWVRTIEHGGVTRSYDVSRSWAIFGVKGVRLPESIRGAFPQGAACVPIEGVNIDFAGSNEPNPQNIIFSKEISLGKLVP